MADEAKQSTISEVTVDGFTFKVDTDLLDDVEAFEYIDKIENKGQVAAIVPLLTFMVGDKGYAEIKAHFTQADAEAHKDEKDYKPRFRLQKLNEVYLAIIEKFNPKG